jgi:hypothetical protein
VSWGKWLINVDIMPESSVQHVQFGVLPRLERLHGVPAQELLLLLHGIPVEDEAQLLPLLHGVLDHGIRIGHC